MKRTLHNDICSYGRIVIFFIGWKILFEQVEYIAAFSPDYNSVQGVNREKLGLNMDNYYYIQKY